MEKIKWGILAPGGIAHRFARDMQNLDDCCVAAVASRSLDKAKAFEPSLSYKAYGSYGELIADPDIDAVYIASPHPFHAEQAISCLQAGKAVLCEKPMAISAAQVQRMIDAAKQNGVLLMEALWIRFLPMMQYVQEAIAEGLIGRPLLADAQFFYPFAYDPKGRQYDPALAGGALLDLGIYSLSFACMALGWNPETVCGACGYAPTGVDSYESISLGYTGGSVASLRCGFNLDTPRRAAIFGESGTIIIPDYWKADEIRLTRGGQTKVLTFPEGSFHYQIKAFSDALREGKKEVPGHPLAHSLVLSRMMDKLLADWGIRYPDAGN